MSYPIWFHNGVKVRYGKLIHLTLLLFVFCSPTSPKKENTVKIGGLAPLTGGDAAWGSVVATTFKHVEDEINSQGGILGKPLKISICDYGDEPEGVRKCLEKFKSEGIKVVVGPDGSESLLSGVCQWDLHPELVETKNCPFVTENKIVVIGTWTTSPVISDLNDDNLIFRVCPSDEFQAAILAKHVLFQGVTKVSVIYRDDWDGREFAKVFKKVFENPPENLTKGTVLAFVPYPHDKMENFKTEVKELYQNGDPDGIFLYTFNEDGINLLVDLRSFIRENNKPTPRLFGCDCNVFPDISGGPAKDIVENNMEGTTIAPPSQDPDYQNFVKISLEKFEDPEAIDFLTYDAAYVAAVAIEAAGAYDPDKIKEKLLEVTTKGEIVKPPSAGGSWKEIKEKIKQGIDIDYKGVSGEVDFLPNGDVKSGTYIIWRITETKGEWTDFKEIAVEKITKEDRRTPIDKTQKIAAEKSD